MAAGRSSAKAGGKMDPAAMMAMMSGAPAGVTEGGQSAFAGITEIVALLDADPTTDWATADIEALWQHHPHP